MVTHLIQQHKGVLCDGAEDPADPPDVPREGGQALLQVLAVPDVCQDPVKPCNCRRLLLTYKHGRRYTVKPDRQLLSLLQLALVMRLAAVKASLKHAGSTADDLSCLRFLTRLLTL